VPSSLILALPNPASHDLGGQPVPSDFGLLDDGHAVVQAQRVGTPSEEKRCDIGMEWGAGLDVAVVLNVNGMAEQSPSVIVVVFDIVAGVKEVPQPGQIFLFDREMSERPRHGGSPLIRARRDAEDTV